MADIIQDAKQLLDGATPAPWEVRTYNIGGAIYGIGEIEPGYGGGDPLDCADKDAYLAAAAPELAQELAEETWEYGVEYKYLTNRGAEWQLDPSTGWHKDCRAAERAAR